jgi:hypothetical protein
VGALRRFGELDIDEDTAALLAGMSAATIDRRLASERRRYQLTGRRHTKPGSLLKARSRSALGPTGTTRYGGSSRSTHTTDHSGLKAHNRTQLQTTAHR